jgi:hypothetical protein
VHLRTVVAVAEVTSLVADRAVVAILSLLGDEIETCCDCCRAKTTMDCV